MVLSFWLLLRPPAGDMEGARAIPPPALPSATAVPLKVPGSHIEPAVLVWLDCGDARRLVMPEEIAYTRDDLEAGAEKDLLVSCEVSEDGAFKSCRVVQKPERIDATKVLRAMGTWRYSIPPSETHIQPGSCLVRFQFMRPATVVPTPVPKPFR